MPVLVYSLLRLLLIVAAGAALYLAGMRGWLLVVVAVLVGAGLSYVLLDKQRRASAEWLAARGRGHTRLEDRLAADADEEDALLVEEEPDAESQNRDDAGQAGPDRQTGPEGPTGSDSQDDEQAKPDDQL